MPPRLPRNHLVSEALERVQGLVALVERDGACALPGVGINYNVLVPLIKRAMARGFVKKQTGDFVLRGLWFGFDLGIDLDAVKGRRWFNNYPSAWANREAVTEAQRKRVAAQKTIALFPIQSRSTSALPWTSCRVFPLGAVPKPLEPGTVRPVSDHTRSGLKAATDLEQFKHTLNTYNEIASFLKPGYFMRMSDVDGAFPLLPLAPRLWPFFLCHWYSTEVGDADRLWLYMHLCCDFGAAGVPGTWKLFFADTIVGVARSEGYLTLPLPIYVDDLALIGPVQLSVDAEGERLGKWLAEMGVPTKALKDRKASTLQLALGFVWDSVKRTRTLEEKKLAAYLSNLLSFAKRKSLSLREMQQIGGRLQRAVMTLPRGLCVSWLLSSRSCGG